MTLHTAMARSSHPVFAQVSATASYSVMASGVRPSRWRSSATFCRHTGSLGAFFATAWNSSSAAASSPWASNSVAVSLARRSRVPPRACGSSSSSRRAAGERLRWRRSEVELGA